MNNVKSYSLEELAKHYDATLSNVTRYVSERDYNELLLKLETAEQNAADQRFMKNKAREQRDGQVKKNAELVAQLERLTKSYTKELDELVQRNYNLRHVNKSQALAEHDREVAARVGKAGFVAGALAADSNLESDDFWLHSVSEDYANKIKSGEVKV